jgi:hypothetical protein
MNKIYALPEDDLKGGLYWRIFLLVSKEQGGWTAVGVAFGLAGGVLSIPLALLLWVGARFIGPAGIGPTLNLLSTILFALTFPLLAVGAYCLDRLEKKPPILPLPTEPRPAVLRSWRHLRPRHPHYN